MHYSRRSIPGMFLLLCAASLVGCTSTYRTDPAGQYAKPYAIGSCGREITDAKEQTEKAFFHAANQSCMDPGNEDKAKKFQALGIAAVTATCQEYLLTLYSSDTYLGFSQRQFDIAIVLGTGLMGLNGASTSSFSRAALGAAAVSGTMNNLDNTFLLGPSAESVISLINNGLTLVKERIETLPEADFPETQMRLRNLADVCTAAKIHELIDNAVKQADLEIATATNARADAERQVIREIAALFGEPDLNEKQLIGVYWLTSEAVATTLLSTHIEPKLLSPITADMVRANEAAIQQKLDRVSSLTTRLAPEKARYTEEFRNSAAETPASNPEVEPAASPPAGIQLIVQ